MSSKFHTVMLIDDNEIDNLINQKMIEATGIAQHIYTHTSAKSALEFLNNIVKHEGLSEIVLPDIIFLDIDMPLMDGFQFLDEFDKLSKQTREKCTIIMLTSSINPHDISKAENYPYVKKYINKPLSQDTLENLEF